MRVALIASCKSLIEKLWTKASAALARAKSRAPRDAIDPEVREIFLAELEELTETLESAFPNWRNDPKDHATLQTIRRAFHTLKGSGLIAGAHALGEFCGRIEQLAVRVIEKRLPVTPELVMTVERAIRVLPDCSKSVRESLPTPAEARAIGQQAQKLIGGR